MLRKVLKASVPYAIILLISLFLVDLVCLVTGLFPPKYRMGHETLGFFENPREPGGSWTDSPLPELEGTEDGKYWRNEEGYWAERLMKDIVEKPQGLRVVSLGDSHTALNYKFALCHFGVLQRELRAGGKQGAEVIGAGHGKYSPLQSMTLYEERFAPLGFDAVVLNWYLGNDNYDLLRIDDRPHLVKTANGYEKAPPEWIAFTDPSDQSFFRKSRTMYLGYLLSKRSGIGSLFDKVSYAMNAAAAFGGGPIASLTYVNDLAASREPELWYDAALSAQALNQTLFFHHFPGSMEETWSRARFVLELYAKQAKTRGDKALLVLSPIPSRILAQPDYDDPAYKKILSRMPFDHAAAVAMEQKTYDALKRDAIAAGWLFVDTLPALRAHAEKRLYLASDLHIAPEGSEIVGREQAKVILDALPSTSSVATTRH